MNDGSSPAADVFEGFGPVSAFSQNSWDDPIAYIIGILSWYNSLSSQVEMDDSCPIACDPVTSEPYLAGQRPDDLRREEQIAFLQSLLVGLRNLGESAAEVYLTDQTPRTRRAGTGQLVAAPASSEWLGRENRYNRTLILLLREIANSAVDLLSYISASTANSAPEQYRGMVEANSAYLQSLVEKIELLIARDARD